MFLPLLVMLFGSNLAWAFFMSRLGDPALAGMETFRWGPVIWSILQVVLLLLAIYGLKRMVVSLSALVGLERGRLRGDLMRAVALAVVGVAIIQVFTGAIQMLLGSSESLSFHPFTLLWWTTVGSITAGVGEEAYFRGFLMERLSWMGRGWLLFVTSFAFALWHVNPLLFPHTFALGLIFGYFYLRWGRLFPIMLAHTLINTIGGVMMMVGMG